MAELAVSLYGAPLGRLVGDWRTFDFRADTAAVTRFGLDSSLLSVAIPLAPVPTRAGKAARQAFFAELLPEGRMLTRLAREARVSEHDVIGMLSRHGRDIAGALEIWDPTAPGEPRTPTTESLTDDGVAHLLRTVQENPLGNRPVGGKTSLAGVQDKLVLARIGERWHRVLDGYPSTHILKPLDADSPTGIYDEEFGARLARGLGLASHTTTIQTFAGEPALVVERYDRDPEAPDRRVHQEDLSQALGLRGDQKYQRHGGRATLARLARVVRAHAGTPGLVGLLRHVTLAVALGNLDLHTKNLSLLHPLDGPITLAPAYDVVPMAHRPNDGELALAVNETYRHAAVTASDVIAEGAAWGLGEAESVVTETLDRIRALVEAEAPHARAHPGLTEDIGTFVDRLLRGDAAGQPGGSGGARTPPGAESG